MPRSRHNQGLGHPRRIARYLTALVAALQLVTLGAMWADPASQPLNLLPFELFWAWMHKPSFYPVIAVLTVAPALSVLAWQVRGPHRIGLACCWLAFAAVIYFCFYERVALNLRILWWRFGV